jgi:uncharacterized protein YcbK (DUF882 family)
MALGRVLPLRLRATAIACALLATFAAILPSAATARQDTRTLKLHFTHTGERGVFTFRRNGQYDRKELERINHILRDWRRGEPTRMDPMLLDLIWEIYRQTGSNDYIHIISAYRSPATNEMLRRRSSGVAKQSQHTRGKAMDFFIPGVPLSKLRAIALTMQGGGVGYYPGSGSPFVHVDTGSVRHWPRMTRQQLASLFPKGETLHLPSDGKPLPGYKKALAKRKSGESIAVASAAAPGGSGGRGGNVAGWLNKVFGGGADEAEDDSMAGQPAAAAQPTAVARASEAPRPAAPPASAPSPRPEGVVEVAVAEEASQSELPAAPLPKALPVKTRMLLLAARERAQLAEMALAATEPPPAGSPQARPGDPVAVAALGDRTADPAIDATSADAALAGLYAAAEGGNPEPAAARLWNATAVQGQPAGSADDEGSRQPKSEVAVAALDMAGLPVPTGPAESADSGSAMAAANALGINGRAGSQAASTGTKLELAYAPAGEEVDRPSAVQSRGSARPDQAGDGRAENEAAADPKADRLAVPSPAPVPRLALRLDRPLLQRLMSHETTRTAAFVMLSRPQPRPDLFSPPAGAVLAMTRLGQPRTDRFQRP